MRVRAGILALVCLAASPPLSAASGHATTAVPLRMKDVVVSGNDVYMACSTKLPPGDAHIVRFEPVADMSVVHHMLLYLCPGEPTVR